MLRTRKQENENIAEHFPIGQLLSGHIALAGINQLAEEIVA